MEVSSYYSSWPRRCRDTQTHTFNTHSLIHTHTHSHTLTQTYFSHTLSCRHTLLHIHTHTHFSYTLSLAHTHTHSLFTRSLLHIHAHTHFSHMLSRTCTHIVFSNTPCCTYTQTLFTHSLLQTHSLFTNCLSLSHTHTFHMYTHTFQKYTHTHTHTLFTHKCVYNVDFQWRCVGLLFQCCFGGIALQGPYSPHFIFLYLPNAPNKLELVSGKPFQLCAMLHSNLLGAFVCQHITHLCVKSVCVHVKNVCVHVGIWQAFPALCNATLKLIGPLVSYN